MVVSIDLVLQMNSLSTIKHSQYPIIEWLNLETHFRYAFNGKKHIHVQIYILSLLIDELKNLHLE